MNRSIGLLLFLLLATVVGCQQGDKQNYANVSGTVTYNNHPIEKGQITFATEGRPPTTMDIVDGKFAGQAMVGSNRISVSAEEKAASAPKLSKAAETQIKGYMERRQGQDGDPSGFDRTMVEYIPPEWGAESKQMRVVEAGATNEFKFEIRGK